MNLLNDQEPQKALEQLVEILNAGSAEPSSHDLRQVLCCHGEGREPLISDAGMFAAEIANASSFRTALELSGYDVFLPLLAKDLGLNVFAIVDGALNLNLARACARSTDTSSNTMVWIDDIERTSAATIIRTSSVNASGFDIVSHMHCIERTELLESVLHLLHDLLAPEGIGLVTLPNRLVWEKGGLRCKLGSHQLHLRALLDSGISWHGLHCCVLILSKSPSECEFAFDTSLLRVPTQAKTYLAMSEPNSTDSFRVSVGELTSLSRLVELTELQRYAKHAGLQIYSLKDMLYPSVSEDDGGDRQNACYLVRSDDGIECTNTSSNNENIILNVKESIALAGYLCEYFGTRYGQRTLGRVWDGEITVQDIVMPLPKLEVQLEVLAVLSDIKNTKMKLHEQERRLWLAPNRFQEVRKSLSFIDKRSVMESWLDMLPYPLASILWGYITETNRARRIQRLLRFFEAYSEFSVCVLISLLRQSDVKFQIDRKEWFRSDRSVNWNHASFGNFNWLYERVSKAFRRVQSSTSERLAYARSLNTIRPELLNVFINKEIIPALKRIADFRNSWEAHGGFTHEEEEKRRLGVLEAELTVFRELVSDNFSEHLLLRPIGCKYHQGRYKQEAYLLMGPHAPFKTTTIQTTVPFDHESIYLHCSRTLESLELIPLFKVIDNGGESVCYFYNRLEDAEAITRWVSFHSTRDEFKTATSSSVLAMLNEFRGE